MVFSAGGFATLILTLTVLGCCLPSFAQIDSSKHFSKELGVFPKEKEPELYNFKVSGVYRFFSSFNVMSQPYMLNSAISDTAAKKSLFIGDDSQLPNLLLNFSGMPDKKTAWGFDLYVFQFLDGNIKQTYGTGQVANNKRGAVFSPRAGVRLGTNMGLLLGLNLYGSMETGFGTISVKTGGIHWTSISDLTLGAFTGYNRFVLFERNPWDPISGNVKKRYSQYYELGNINQDMRWGEKAFTGTILEANSLPGNLSMKILYGKTELNGGFLNIPNLSVGGQVKKQFSNGFVAINSFNNNTYTDSLTNKSIGFNMVTGQLKYAFVPGMEFKCEAGMGRYFSPNNKSGWGEAITAKLFLGPELVKMPTELHFFRVAPEVVNNNAIFWNVAVREYNNNIPAGSIGSNAVLLPFASAVTAVGQFTNNRQGVNLNTELKAGRLKLSFSNAISGEIDAVTSAISYTHPVNQFTRSRFWRWTFPTEVGPYSRYNKIYRDVYDRLKLSDTTAKRFNTLEFQAKYKCRLNNRDLYVFALGNYSSVQSKWSPITVFSEAAYLRHYSTQIETYYMIRPKIALAQYAGYERMICNYRTETDALTGRPRNQTGWGYALGADCELAKNTMFYLRHRWYGFNDRSFSQDRFQGREWLVELKLAF